MGTWALPQNDLINSREKDILEHCYDDYDFFLSDYQYISRLYSSLTLTIGKILNSHHFVNWDERSWKIFYGAWLHVYLPVIRERYLTIEKAIIELEDYKFILRDKPLEVYDVEDFNKKITEDDYNLSLYSKIVKFLNKQLYKKSHFIAIDCYENDASNNKFFDIRNYLKSEFGRLLQALFGYLSLKKENSAVDRSYFKKHHFMRLILNPLFKTKPIFYFPKLIPKHTTKCRKTRKLLYKKLLCGFSPKTSFERYLLLNIVEDMPLSFVENFKYLLHQSNYIELQNINYLSCNAILSNQVLQCAIANQLSGNKKLIIAQHGGAYGIPKWSMQQFYELDTADVYISFGWNENVNNKNKNIIPYSHPKLLLKTHNPNKIKLRLLYVTWAPSRYFNRNWSLPTVGNSILNYYSNIRNLLEELNSKTKNSLWLRVAPSADEYDLGIKEFLGKEIKFSEGNFYKEIRDASLVIIDHNTTALVECFAINKPTVVVWNPVFNKLSNTAENIFKEMAEVGIFHSSYTDAAKFINEKVSCNSINEWWSDLRLQKIVRKFSSEYARRNENWVHDYQKILCC